LTRDDGNLLPYLDREAIEMAYGAAPGSEITSGKFLRPESSAALAANAFGPFFADAALLPPLVGVDPAGWPALTVTPERILRFPWRGGRHPCLDIVVDTSSSLYGVESKRYEPFRSKPKASPLSDAYFRPVWGQAMGGYQGIRDDIRDGRTPFRHLDAPQLIKHALGLLAAGQRLGQSATLIYLFAEPDAWPDGRPVPRVAIEDHRREIQIFADRVQADAVKFVSISYRVLLGQWRSANPRLADHVGALERHFAISVPAAANPFWRSDELVGGAKLDRGKVEHVD
jgi:hypothetical protein